MEKLLNFIEGEARANMAFQIANADALAVEGEQYPELCSSRTRLIISRLRNY